ncbi:hypothetical protein FRC00_005773 [Tulasnella sp. 408]|nr:hypothetical protein FRC00_005773 [Tulasnella sp. 408]
MNKLQLLQTHAERWEILDYNINWFPNSDAHRPILEAHAPNLRRISASLPTHWSLPLQTLNLAGGNANHLKHLTLENVLLPWSSRLLIGLETFSLRIEGTVPVEEIVAIFINSPRLRSFDLFYRDTGDQHIPILPTSATSNSVTADSLEELKLCFDNPRIAKSHLILGVHASLYHFQFGGLIGRHDGLGRVMSHGRRTKLSIMPKGPSKWSSPEEEEEFQFSLEFPVHSLEGFVECARNLASNSASTLELAVTVHLGRSLIPRWIGEMLGDWSEITRLHVWSVDDEWDEEDEVALFPDYLGEPKIHVLHGLCWPFPNLRELDLSDLEWPLLKVFDLLNWRYLSSSDVESLNKIHLPVSSPTRLDLRVHNYFVGDDNQINKALKDHRGVESLHYGGLDFEEVENQG